VAVVVMDVVVVVVIVVVVVFVVVVVVVLVVVVGVMGENRRCRVVMNLGQMENARWRRVMGASE
jgi:hypothetical protein